MASRRRVTWPGFDLLWICIFLSGLFVSCSSPISHPAIGVWRGELLTISVHPDHVAIVNGIRCHWAEVDAVSIRIDPPKVEGDNWFIQLLRNVAAELRVRQEPKGKAAILNLPGVPGMEWRLEKDRSR
jgi:hypothetical protein